MHTHVHTHTYTYKYIGSFVVLARKIHSPPQNINISPPQKEPCSYKLLLLKAHLFTFTMSPTCIQTNY